MRIYLLLFLTHSNIDYMMINTILDFVQVMGKKEVYQLLCILDFNNIRKRMSVILQRNDELKLFCKGADNVIYERLKEGDEHLKFKTLEHLNVTLEILRSAGGVKMSVLIPMIFFFNLAIRWRRPENVVFSGTRFRRSVLSVVEEKTPRSGDVVGSSRRKTRSHI